MSLRGFLELVRAQSTIVRRNTSFWLISMMVAIMSMGVFGWLFHPGPQPFTLAFVDEDRTEASAGLREAFAELESVRLRTGDLRDEMEALRDGRRAALIAIPSGFGEGLATGLASVRVYYDRSDPVRVSYTAATVQTVVDGYAEAAGSGRGIRLETLEVDTRNVEFIDFLTPGMVGLTIMFTNLGVGFLLVSWREQGILRRLGVTPLRPGVLISTQAVSFALISIVQVTIILSMGYFFFGVAIAGSFLWLAVTILLGVLTMLSLGYVIASFIRTPNAVNATVNLVAFPMMFLGRSYFPIDAPPALAPSSRRSR
jgi:ABC-2 type transport system permease protein